MAFRLMVSSLAIGDESGSSLEMEGADHSRESLDVVSLSFARRSMGRLSGISNLFPLSPVKRLVGGLTCFALEFLRPHQANQLVRQLAQFGRL